MDKTEKWIQELYTKPFKLDVNSVREFIRKELRLSPMENPTNSMNVISGCIDLFSGYNGIFLMELINYEKELRKNNNIKDKQNNGEKSFDKRSVGGVHSKREPKDPSLNDS